MRCSSPGTPGSGGTAEIGGFHGDAGDGCGVEGNSVPSGNDGGWGRRGSPDCVLRNAHRSLDMLDAASIWSIDLPGPIQPAAYCVGMAM